jgi:hypothetical protein
LRCVVSEKALKDDNNRLEKGDGEDSQDSERYTIFHALFEALKDKDKKHKK